MIRSTARSLWVCVLVLGLSTKVAWAQQPSAAPPAATQTAVDDDEQRADPAEPDFRLINLPTTLRLPRLKGTFTLTHRFNGNLADYSLGEAFENMFGMDQGASIGLEYRFAPVSHVQAVVFRTNISRVIQFTGKYDAVHEGVNGPVSISAIVAVEGENNFRENYSPTLGVVVSRKIANRVAIYGTPVWVHNTALATGTNQDTTYLGLGMRLEIRNRTYLVGEVTPRMTGYQPGDPLYGFAIEKRVGGHVFQLNFTNGQATTFGQIARGGSPSTLYLGFNLSRKFF